MNKIKYLIYNIILISVFIGCGTQTLPPYKVYDFQIDKNCCNTTYKKQHLNIKIIEPITTKALNTTSLYYSNNKYRLQTYKLSKWSDYPSKMMLSVLSSKLDELKLYDNITTSNIYSQTDYTLQSEFIDFKQIIKNNVAYVHMKIKFYLVNTHNNKKITSKIFEYKTKCTQINAYGSVVALNKTISYLINDLALWLQTNTKGN